MNPSVRSRLQQQGAATVEFTLCLMLIVIIMLGLTSLGAYVWAQQKISYAAGEGTRSLSIKYHTQSSHINQAGSCEHIKNDRSLCEQALTASGFLQPHSSCSIELNTCTSVTNPLLDEWKVCTYTLALSYEASSNALIQPLNQLRALLDGSEDATTNLKASSSVNTLCLPSEN